MPREIPNCPKKPNPALEAGRSYEIELITPMFGGGVEPGVNDPSFPIRPTAIRGQLQFWWRATVGAQYATREQLRAAQSAIWGSTERASRVQVLVEAIDVSDPVPCAKIEWNPKARQGKGAWRLGWQAPFNTHDSALPYALFPFQGELPPPKKNELVTVPPAACIHQANFRLTIHCPNDRWPQVEPAVWAWVNFGGLGCRTRRGCGTILCKEFAPRDHDQFVEQLKQWVPYEMPVREWPTVADNVLLRTVHPPGEPIRGWDWLIGLYKHFRQGVKLARNTGQQRNRPGRSRYPEPETIRRVTGQRSGQHARLGHIPDDAFPRAELGLPIVFHFKDDRAGDPPDTVLYPSNGSDGKRRERMASPLILKPLVLGNGKAIPLILRLKAPQLNGVDLRRGETSLSLPPSTAIRDSRLSTYRDSPLGRSPDGSALEAFLAFACPEGFTEVTR
jgi:CRISPR-associated protein Cmr1